MKGGENMAAGSKLVLEFKGTDGNVKFSYNYANPDVQVSKVKALVNGMATHGAVFENPPVEAISAKIVTTTEEDYDLSE